jgi:hypothetical protein
MPVENPAKKCKVTKVDTAPRQSSRSRQPSTQALQHLYKEAETEHSDDEMDLLLLGSDASLDNEDGSEGDDEELLEEESQEVEGGNCSEDETVTAVDSGGEEPAPVVPSKCTHKPGKGAYLLLFTVPPY